MIEDWNHTKSVIGVVSSSANKLFRLIGVIECLSSVNANELSGAWKIGQSSEDQRHQNYLTS